MKNESGAEARQTKVTLRAPCVYQDWSDVHQKVADVFPAVNCNYDCSHCGWNPDVAKARLQKMGYTNGKGA